MIPAPRVHRRPGARREPVPECPPGPVVTPCPRRESNSRGGCARWLLSSGSWTIPALRRLSSPRPPVISSVTSDQTSPARIWSINLTKDATSLGDGPTSESWPGQPVQRRCRDGEPCCQACRPNVALTLGHSYVGGIPRLVARTLQVHRISSRSLSGPGEDSSKRGIRARAADYAQRVFECAIPHHPMHGLRNESVRPSVSHQDLNPEHKRRRAFPGL